MVKTHGSLRITLLLAELELTAIDVIRATYKMQVIVKVFQQKRASSTYGCENVSRYLEAGRILKEPNF